MRNNQKLRLGIIGHGFVGKATDWGFNKNVQKFIVDPIHKTNVENLREFKPEIVFICVPTPMNKDGSQNLSYVQEVFKNSNEKPIYILKSTVLPLESVNLPSSRSCNSRLNTSG